MTVLFQIFPAHEDETEFIELKTLIKKKIGFNCDGYKQAHLKRRLAVRLRANNSRTYKEYTTTLLRNEDEIEKLKQTLTVNVTELFRNPETFEAFIIAGLPELIRTKGEDRNINVWSAGCSNGEEPYSIAIMLLEFLGHRANRYNISILGTDIDDDSIKTAEKGIYNPKQIEKISKERMERFFNRVDDDYVLTEDIRRLVRFKHHDMLSGPRMYGFDIIFCRNVTIYFDKDQQEKLYMDFYDSLNKGGYFLMGKTETLFGKAGELFKPVDIKERIYRKVN